MMKLIRRFVAWMETGDLIPALLAVSVPHYANVLQRYDFWPVAAALGFLVDVGHYRTIKLYLRNRGALWMIVLTVFSAGFHIAFYALGGAGGFALALGLAPTMVIFALAYITKNERLDAKAQPATSKDDPKTQPQPAMLRRKPIAQGAKAQFLSDMAGRNGAGPLTTSQIMAQYNVSERTAQYWLTAYRDQHDSTVRQAAN